MLIQFDCCECIASQLIRLAGSGEHPAQERWEFLRRSFQMFLDGHDKLTPPELAAGYFEIYSQYSGISDGFTVEKKRSTELALQLYEHIYPQLKDGWESFAERMKLAVGGNMIDYGVHPDFDLDMAEKLVMDALNLECDFLAAADLAARMQQAGNILYILDNCGEAVLDRLLLELIKDKVTIGVRGKPILNDITRAELADSGLDGMPVVDTGCGAPGAPWKMVSDEFKQAVLKADLVIAKGQGNFESMESDFTAVPVYYLLRAKCPVIQRYLNVPAGSLQIIGKNLI